MAATGRLIFFLAVLHSLSVIDGITYTRWGRTTCAGDATVFHTGYAASAKWDETGSGKNYICLADQPEWGKVTAGVQGGSRLFGTQYALDAYWAPFSMTSFPNSKTNQVPMPCVICDSPNTKVQLASGSINCPAGWNSEYNGYLGALYQQASEWICIDGTPEPRGAVYGAWQAHFHVAEVFCGTLPCSVYPDGNEVSCAVCSSS